MQKEDFLRKLRLFATGLTLAFMVLVVGLVVQFGVIAHQNTEKARLQAENARLQPLIADLEADHAYYEEVYPEEQAIQMIIDGKIR